MAATWPHSSALRRLRLPGNSRSSPSHAICVPFDSYRIAITNDSNRNLMYHFTTHLSGVLQMSQYASAAQGKCVENPPQAPLGVRACTGCPGAGSVAVQFGVIAEDAVAERQPPAAGKIRL